MQQFQNCADRINDFLGENFIQSLQNGAENLQNLAVIDIELL